MATADKPAAASKVNKSSAPEGGGWFVQLGVFAVRENAERLASQARGKGFKVVVAPSREIVHGVMEGRWELGFGPFHHSMPSQFDLHPCFAETRRLMIALDHPLRPELARDAVAALRKLPLVTSALDDSTRRANGERLRDAFGSVWEVSHMELRFALVTDGKGVTYVSDLFQPVPEKLVAIDGLPHSSIERQVGVYRLKHQPASQAATRFLAICHERWRFKRSQRAGSPAAPA